MSTLTIIIIAGLSGALLGVGGAVGVMRATQPQDTPSAVAEAIPSTVEAALAPEATEAEATLSVASAPAASIAIAAAVQPGASPVVVLLGAYVDCLSAAVTQEQGGAAFQCGELAKALIEATKAEQP